METDKILRIGIIGIGNIGTAHANTLYKNRVENAKLCALCDISPSVEKRVHEDFADVPFYRSYKDLLKSKQVDAVIISTPHKLHPVIACEAFDAEIHVLSEKPLGIDCKTVDLLCEKAKSSNKVFGVMFNQRSDFLYSKAKELIDSGALGEIKRSIWIITNWYRTQEYYDSGDWRGTWLGEGGGVLINQAVHNLDLWQWICGMPKSVKAECYFGKYHKIEVEDDVNIFTEYENGATGTFITSTGDPFGTNRLEISCEKGKLVLENGKLEVTGLSDSSKEKENLIYTDKEYNGHVEILKDFTSSVLWGTPLLASGFEGIHELEISNAAYLSAFTGKKINLPLDRAEFENEFEKHVAASKLNTDKKSKYKESTNIYIDRWKTNW